MSFRVRLTLLASLAVAVAIVGTSAIVYYTYRHELIGQVDSELSSGLAAPAFKTTVGDTVATGAAGKLLGFGAPKVLVPPKSGTALQVRVRNVKTNQVVVGGQLMTITTQTIGGVPYRVLFVKFPNAEVKITRSLLDVNHSLDRLRLLLAFISVGGIGVAAALGAVVSGAALGPLRRLTEKTERIVETGDLSERVGQPGRDEISRLSGRLDELLATLESSLNTQRQLVADASHELRTPLATLRANVELLAGPNTLDAEERQELVTDVREELEAMSDLVAELVELARGEEPDIVHCEFRLDEVVRTAVERAARRATAVWFTTALEPVTVSGVPERAERAVANLLDNARKWSPPGGTVDVAVRDGIVEVRDHGPGVDPADAPLVFNRFYRSARARSMPGAGLGLSIVKQIADAHGGSVVVDRADGGGAIFRLQLSPSR
jgi:two-component system sensor histidine kinase MprB